MTISDLASHEHDLLVIGGGIHGAFAALEAARRGWRVALAERADFGGATSANSMRILHGGFRYLRSAHVSRLRESARERDHLLRVAPRLAQPLPCIAPVGTPATAGALAFRAAVAAYGVVAPSDPSAGAQGRMLSVKEYRELAGAFAVSGAAGGAQWMDGFLPGAERLLMDIIRTAETRGGSVVNHAACETLITSHGAVRGARLRDGRSGDLVEVRARCILNAAGPWAAAVAGDAAPAWWARGCNIVVRCEPPGAAVAVPAADGRLLFAVPFGRLTLLGTWYSPARDGRTPPLEADALALLGAFQRTLPALELDASDIVRVHAGELPLARTASGSNVAGMLAERPIVVDHASAGGPAGLVTLVGVKWTTARAAALRALTVVGRAIGRNPGVLPDENLHGGGSAPPNATALERHYGSGAADVLAEGRGAPELLQPICPEHPAIGAEVIHAIRREQAHTLSDIVIRRMGIGIGEPPPDALLSGVAHIAARELGWSDAQRASEIAALRTARMVP